jgi:hypothetical protein
MSEIISKNSEPKVIRAGVRSTTDEFGYPMLDIECRFSDGQKFAAVRVDGDYESLAHDIADFLNSQYYLEKSQC